MKIAILCGARSGNRPEYEQLSYTFGAELARRGHTLVYGGNVVGIMGAVARGAIESGGRVEALVVPDFGEEQFPEAIRTDFRDLAQRKSRMWELADAVIALPGGWGTMDELFEILVLRQWGVFHGKIGICSPYGYYAGLPSFLDSFVHAGFTPSECQTMWYLSEDSSDLLSWIEKPTE